MHVKLIRHFGLQEKKTSQLSEPFHHHYHYYYYHHCRFSEAILFRKHNASNSISICNPNLTAEFRIY